MVKSTWAKGSIEKLYKEAETTLRVGQTSSSQEKIISKWANEEAGTQRHQEILSTEKGPRNVATRFMREGLLGHFLLASKRTDRAEGRGT